MQGKFHLWLVGRQLQVHLCRVGESSSCSDAAASEHFSWIRQNFSGFVTREKKPRLWHKVSNAANLILLQEAILLIFLLLDLQVIYVWTTWPYTVPKNNRKWLKSY